MHRLKVLIIDPQSIIREGMNGFLAPNEMITFHTREPHEALKIINNNQIDLALINLEDNNGIIKLVKQLKSKYPEIDEIVFDGTGDKRQLFDSFDSKSFLYITKPFYWKEISKKIKQSRSFQNHQCKLEELETNFRHLANMFEKQGGSRFIGVSPAMKTLASTIMMVARSDDTSVLITGESGTGKELVARGIHYAGNRVNNPFHAVNCSAIPDSLFESEFFGYHKGSFTGASEKTIGWFESSDQGTLFLDEVTELPPAVQSKFLRVLDDKTITRIGSHHEIKLNLRIISATNQDFGQLLAKNAFRTDLFHRLNSFHIHIPPLRERKEDIPVLIDYFLTEVSHKLKKPKNEICPDAIESITNYSFPGNVRELKNIVERAVIMAQNDKIRMHHLIIEPRNFPDLNNSTSSEKSMILDEVEKKAIVDALEKTRNNKSRAAALLAISRQALDRKIIKLKLIKVA